MIKVQDLEIEKELFPLLNYTNHRLAADVLLRLLTDVPRSLHETLDRQDMLKTFVAGWDHLQYFTYSKADLHEVYGFTNSHIQIDRIGLIINTVKKQQLRSSVIQCLTLFHKLHGFFAQLPPTISLFVHRIQQFLDAFQAYDASDILPVVTIIQNKSKVTEFWNDLFLFEAYYSMARAHICHNFCFPEFAGERFEVTGIFHPLLKEPVKNTITNSQHVVLLTGPNMSGKSTFLKSVGLCVYLAHVGLGVPAAACVMPFFDTICVAIHLKDDIKSGYSHFLSEIKTLKQVVSDAASNKRCFAVFDELFRGTNLEDALEIGTTTIRGLTRYRHSQFFISTHLHQLKERLPQQHISTYYVDTHIKNNQPVFTYQLKTGWSEVKIGQLLFEQEGLNQLLNA